MPQIQAVRASQHRRYSWLPFTHYQFAAKDAYAPLVVHEFKQAGAIAPIAFTQGDSGYSPALMMGLYNDSNLMVSAKGKWLGNYVPAYYRSHPFCMAKNQNGEMLLCFHGDSEFVLDHIVPGSKGKPFLAGSELSDDLQDIKRFLENVEANRLVTAQFCATCEELELFTPWQLQIKDGAKPLSINGLYCIDEAKLKALPAEQAKTLLETGALAAIYYHLGSLQHTKQLLSLKQHHEDAAAKADAVDTVPDLFTHASADESIDLDW